MNVRFAARGLVVVLGAACGEPAARVSLVPVGGGACGRPADATGLKVTAYGEAGEVTRAVGLDQALAITDFPADTLALGVEVIGAAGATAAIGKTGPLAFDALADGATIPIFMAPPDGACALPDLGTPRASPLVALAGDGVLIAGGTGAAGPLSTAERYDPATATFAPVAVPDALADPDNGLSGGVLTSLPDGRVVLTGTTRGVLAIYDPATHAFGTPALIDRRALHAAVAIDADHLLVAGGCADIAAGACNGVALRSTLVYQLSDLSHVGGAVLGDGDPRTNGALIDVGPRSGDGARAYAFASGEPEPGRLARFAIGDANAAELDGLPAQVVALDGGALLAAFGSDGAPASDQAVVVAPGAMAATPVAPPPAAAGARMVALEDGRALAIGGTADGSVATYDPTLDAWTAGIPPGDPIGALVAPTLLRLADGSVLVLSDGHAWIYRPSLVGPQAGTVVALPDGSTGGVLTPPDPTRVTRAQGRMTLTAPDPADLSVPARVLVGGPRIATGSVEAVVSVSAGGVGLIGQQVGPGRALFALFVPGEPAAIARVGAGDTGASCTGSMVDAFGATATTLGLAVRDHTATATRDGAVLATCELDTDPDAGDVGSWGAAAVGSGAVVDVLTVTVAR